MKASRKLTNAEAELEKDQAKAEESAKFVESIITS